MISFDDFKRNFGWKYKIDGEVEAAYERRERLSQGGQLTEDEFVMEAGEYHEPATLKAVYARLMELVQDGRLKANDVLAYAAYKWCLRDTSAIVAYQISSEHWEVNNCDTAVTEAQAKILVNSEWGFEASQIRIIESPYYDATDFQFIRFDCAQMTWLWINGNLYQVYA